MRERRGEFDDEHSIRLPRSRKCPRGRDAEFGRPKCPRCGSVLLIAEISEFNLKGRIHHAWSCDDCAHEFVTSITL
jgi:transposase-like protein